MMAASPEPPGNRAYRIFCRVCLLLAFIAAVYALVSCGVQKPVATQHDSVRVEIRERIVRDIVSITLPPVYIERTVKDTTSHIESEYAQSDAAIRGGFLFHSLTGAPKTIRVPVYKTVHDTTIIERQAQTVFVDVPRQPTKWESFLEVCGYILLGIVTLTLVALTVWLILKFSIK